MQIFSMGRVGSDINENLADWSGSLFRQWYSDRSRKNTSSVKQVREFSDILLFSYFVEKSANFIKHINRKITTYKTGEMKKWQRYHGSWENSSYIKRLNGFLDRTGFDQGGIK